MCFLILKKVYSQLLKRVCKANIFLKIIIKWKVSANFSNLKIILVLLQGSRKFQKKKKRKINMLKILSRRFKQEEWMFWSGKTFLKKLMKIEGNNFKINKKVTKIKLLKNYLMMILLFKQKCSNKKINLIKASLTTR